MTFNQIIKHYGSFTNAMNELGLSSGQLANWKERGVPKTQQQLISLKTNGELKVCVRKKAREKKPRLASISP